MAGSSNQAWNLESFVDSFIVELDKAQDTLSVKGLTRKLTYTVKDVNLDLHIFPQYKNGRIQFVAAGPGEEGASRLSMQLGSITNRQIKDVTKDPPKKDDIDIELIEELDDDVKHSLQQVGVSSVDDLERMDAQNVDLDKVVREKVGKDKPTFKDLASIIRKSRRKRLAPALSAVRVEGVGAARALTLEGQHLVTGPSEGGFPAALLNGEPLSVAESTGDRVILSLPQGVLKEGRNRLEVALDPFAVMTVEVQAEEDDPGGSGQS